MKEKMRVKFISIGFPTYQIPLSNKNIFDNVEFLLEENDQNYDWVVVGDDVVYNLHKVYSIGVTCPREKIILMTYEPSSIKVFSKKFLSQFGHIVTCHENNLINHPNIYPATPYNVWHYNRNLGYEQVSNMKMPLKNKTISIVGSAKNMPYTLHKQRLRFTKKLKSNLDDFDIYGRASGGKEIDDKQQAIDPYKYYIAIENSLSPNYWTEKISDAFLGYSLPFYYGCDNIADYFPEQSFIKIDIHDFPKSLDIIKNSIANNEYEKRLPAIKEARRRVIQEYNYFNWIAKQVELISQNQPPIKTDKKYILKSRRLINLNPYYGLIYNIKKISNRIRNYIKYTKMRIKAH